MIDNLTEYEKIYQQNNFKLSGLTNAQVSVLRKKYGINVLSKQKKKSVFLRIIKALFEPMMLILTFAFIITVGVNVGDYLSGRRVDFLESLGILLAICVCVGLTIIMESKSEKAFEMLEKFTDKIPVTVIRNNVKRVIDYSELCVGDVIYLEAGEKITADALIINCNQAESEQSTLSGESCSVKKYAYKSGKITSDNMLFSGTYLKNGNATCIVLAVGDNAQIGKIASGLKQENNISAPLNEKLNRLTTKISIFGGISAFFVFLLSVIRLILTSNCTFVNISQAFIETIVLIVAAVPEGLPTTVAISLALSVVKLAKSNAIIKKLVATETVGCVSVICSDKTGTLTFGKMQVSCFCINGREIDGKNLNNRYVIDNVAVNSTAEINKKDSGGVGNATEQALLSSVFNSRNDYQKIRKSYKVVNTVPFCSQNKYMLTTVATINGEITFFKGSIEKCLEFCNTSSQCATFILNSAKFYENKAERVIAFAHDVGNGFVFDGFCSITDKIRDDVYSSIQFCKNAGIKIKMLTGDNIQTALAVAKKLGIASGYENACLGSEVEKMTDERLIEILPNLTVVARSTPDTKLRIVKLLKRCGEVVAVTGDGVNDAPAVKNADIGISMGDGSEITKEASDIILLDNSFSVIVKAVAFGRNIYANFQRFLMFQLTVNISAVTLIFAFLLMGFESPFSALQLLWINVIMDGPLALSLGLEKRNDRLMDLKPVKRSDEIVTKKMFARIIIHSLIIVSLVVAQKQYNFLRALEMQKDTVIFSMFVLLQLFNGCNARELGQKSIFKNFFSNKLFSVLLIFTAVCQIIICNFACKMFSTSPLDFNLWVKVFGVCALIILISELYKLIYKFIKNKQTKSSLIKSKDF